LKVKDRILGSLTVDRIQAHSLTQDDLELMMTVAHQVAIALDNASAYEQIEELNETRSQSA
jgi:GAF domain-containing protein